MPTYVLQASPECLAACGCSTVCCVTAKFKFWLIARTGSLGGVEYVTWDIYYNGVLVESSKRRINGIDNLWDLGENEGGMDFLGSASIDPMMWGMMPAGSNVSVAFNITNTRWRQLASRLCGGDGSKSFTWHSSGSHTFSETIQTASAPADPTGYPWEDETGSSAVQRYAVTSEQTITLCR